MNSDLAKAIYALLSFLTGRLIFESAKAYYRKFRMLRQLRLEVIGIQSQIDNNRKQLEAIAIDSSSWPLLSILDLSIHENQIEHIITNTSISQSAKTFITNCKHYNRIIEWGDNGVFHRIGLEESKSRRKQLIQQGALIYNQPEHLFQQDPVTGQRIGTHKGHSEIYESKLHEQLKKKWKWLKFIPLYPLFFILTDDSDSHLT